MSSAVGLDTDGRAALAEMSERTGKGGADLLWLGRLLHQAKGRGQGSPTEQDALSAALLAEADYGTRPIVFERAALAGAVAKSWPGSVSTDRSSALRVVSGLLADYFGASRPGYQEIELRHDGSLACVVTKGYGSPHVGRAAAERPPAGNQRADIEYGPDGTYSYYDKVQGHFVVRKSEPGEDSDTEEILDRHGGYDPDDQSEMAERYGRTEGAAAHSVSGRPDGQSAYKADLDDEGDDEEEDQDEDDEEAHASQRTLSPEVVRRWAELKRLFKEAGLTPVSPDVAREHQLLLDAWGRFVQGRRR
jgi:hypothetical protein